MTEEDIIKLGRAIERLKQNKDYQLVVEQWFLGSFRDEQTKHFDGGPDQIDALKAIAFYDNEIENMVEYAKQLNLKG